MDKEKLKAFALCNIDEFDEFFEKHEKKMICMFATYLNKRRVYHICFMDFTALIFYKVIIEGIKINKIKVEDLKFEDVIGAMA